MLYTTLHRAGLSAHLEEGSSWSIEKPKSRPADILVANWDRGFSAAFDVSVTSPLNPLHIVEAGISPGAAAKATEERKHRNNDAKCEELGWRCIPMVVESYGCWGTEARQALSPLASRLAVRTNTYKSQMLNSLYGRLNLTLIRCNTRAILSRSHFASSLNMGSSVVKPWCSMVLMVVVTVVVILLSRMYLFDILTWLEGLPVVESILLFVVLFTIVSFPFAFGYIVLNMMAGYLYGFVTGQFVVSVSVTFGLVISMGLCRRYFANYAQTHFTSTPFMALMKVLEGPSGLKVMVMARLTPVPFGIQNALFAMTKMDLWRCLLASVIGLTPTQLLNTYMGSTVVFSVGLVFYIGRKAKMELDKLTSNEEHQNSNQISDIIV
ncbi:hypothetical protein EMCRGX_G030871 [Ephydatia muelleri]